MISGMEFLGATLQILNESCVKHCQNSLSIIPTFYTCSSQCNHQGFSKNMVFLLSEQSNEQENSLLPSLVPITLVSIMVYVSHFPEHSHTVLIFFSVAESLVLLSSVQCSRECEFRTDRLGQFRSFGRRNLSFFSKCCFLSSRIHRQSRPWSCPWRLQQRPSIQT